MRIQLGELVDIINGADSKVPKLNEADYFIDTSFVLSTYAPFERFAKPSTRKILYNLEPQESLNLLTTVKNMIVENEVFASKKIVEELNNGGQYFQERKIHERDLEQTLRQVEKTQKEIASVLEKRLPPRNNDKLPNMVSIITQMASSIPETHGVSEQDIDLISRAALHYLKEKEATCFITNDKGQALLAKYAIAALTHETSSLKICSGNEPFYVLHGRFQNVEKGSIDHVDFNVVEASDSEPHPTIYKLQAHDKLRAIQRQSGTTGERVSISYSVTRSPGSAVNFKNTFKTKNPNIRVKYVNSQQLLTFSSEELAQEDLSLRVQSELSRYNAKNNLNPARLDEVEIEEDTAKYEIKENTGILSEAEETIRLKNQRISELENMLIESLDKREKTEDTLIELREKLNQYDQKMYKLSKEIASKKDMIPEIPEEIAKFYDQYVQLNKDIGNEVKIHEEETKQYKLAKEALGLPDNPFVNKEEASFFVKRYEDKQRQKQEYESKKLKIEAAKKKLTDKISFVGDMKSNEVKLYLPKERQYALQRILAESMEETFGAELKMPAANLTNSKKAFLTKVYEKTGIDFDIEFRIQQIRIY